MRRPLPTARAAAALTIALALLTAGVAVASAEQDATFVPFGQVLRRCDFSEIKNVGGTGYARPTAQVWTDGSEVVADIQLNTGVPNTRYDARLIQVPRSSAVSCNGGESGVAGTVLFTNSAGAGAASVRGPVVSGATGAWLFITIPSAHSQVPKEFYTSDFIAAL